MCSNLAKIIYEFLPNTFNNFAIKVSFYAPPPLEGNPGIGHVNNQILADLLL